MNEKAIRRIERAIEEGRRLEVEIIRWHWVADALAEAREREAIEALLGQR
jgi:hypothetical protein